MLPSGHATLCVCSEINSGTDNPSVSHIQAMDMHLANLGQQVLHHPIISVSRSLVVRLQKYILLYLWQI
jgi:hypothetical protein